MKRRRAERKPYGLVGDIPIAHSNRPRPRPILGLVTTGLWFVALVLAFCGTAQAQNEHGTVMLVRGWNPKDGELIGWLPTHSIAMSFQLVASGEDHFDLNQAVTLTWMNREGTSPGSTGDIHISPVAQEFGGQKWLPLARDANLVRIKRSLFLICQIVFEGSPYQGPTKVRPHACSNAEGFAKSSAAPCPRSKGD